LSWQALIIGPSFGVRMRRLPQNQKVSDRVARELLRTPAKAIEYSAMKLTVVKHVGRERDS
jgi:hypothetical protein